ncbi:10641_t:CDS:2, partial [Scutellospora calospora]
GGRLEKVGKDQHSIRLSKKYRLLFYWDKEQKRAYDIWIDPHNKDLHPIHPGEILREELLKTYQITPQQLAKSIKVEEMREDYWLDLQKHYELECWKEQQELKKIFVLTKEKDQKEIITYHLRPLVKPIIVNDRLIKYVGISSHCDKHLSHGITRELVIELVELLNTRYFPFSGKQGKQKNYFKDYPEKDGENASVSEKTKYQFSQVITRYLVKNNLSESEMSQKLGLDKDTTAKLLRGYVENFSLDSLIAYVDKLHLPLQVKITEATRRTNPPLPDILGVLRLLIRSLSRKWLGSVPTARKKTPLFQLR